MSSSEVEQYSDSEVIGKRNSQAIKMTESQEKFKDLVRNTPDILHTQKPTYHCRRNKKILKKLRIKDEIKLDVQKSSLSSASSSTHSRYKLYPIDEVTEDSSKEYVPKRSPEVERLLEEQRQRAKNRPKSPMPGARRVRAQNVEKSDSVIEIHKAALESEESEMESAFGDDPHSHGDQKTTKDLESAGTSSTSFASLASIKHARLLECTDNAIRGYRKARAQLCSYNDEDVQTCDDGEIKMTDDLYVIDRYPEFRRYREYLESRRHRQNPPHCQNSEHRSKSCFGKLRNPIKSLCRCCIPKYKQF